MNVFFGKDAYVNCLIWAAFHKAICGRFLLPPWQRGNVFGSNGLFVGLSLCLFVC